MGTGKCMLLWVTQEAHLLSFADDSTAHFRWSQRNLMHCDSQVGKHLVFLRGLRMTSDEIEKNQARL